MSPRVIAVPCVPENAIDSVRLLVKPVVTDFVQHVQQNQQTTRKPNGQACNVDRGIKRVPQQIPPGHCEIIPEHRPTPLGLDQSRTVLCPAPPILRKKHPSEDAGVKVGRTFLSARMQRRPSG